MPRTPAIGIPPTYLWLTLALTLAIIIAVTFLVAGRMSRLADVVARQTIAIEALAKRIEALEHRGASSAAK